MTEPKLAPDKYCTGCLACYDSCRHNAIKIIQKNGLTHVTVNKDNCIGCRLCEKSCPIVTPVSRNSVADMRAYGGWCNIDEYRIKGASGGAFAALALSFFAKFDKAAVVGASLENNRVKHIVIEHPEDIPLLMNSKYIQSDTCGIYAKVKRKLSEGYNVMFSGTPCQIAGLYAFLGKGKDDFKLVTVELVCHGIPGNEALDLHLKYYNSNKIYSFRDKREGQYWYASQRTTIDIDGNPVKIPRNEDVFYRIFSGWMLDRESCSNCVYSEMPRVADITLADFWGASVNEQEFMKGVSLITANSIHGRNFITSSSDYLYQEETSILKAMRSNSNLYTGYKFIQYHPIVMFPDFFRKVFPEKVRFNILTNKYPWRLLWGVFKVLTKYAAKRKYKQVVRKYKFAEK